MTFQKFISRIYALAGILSLAYYGVCVAYAWVGVSWLWIWLLFSAFCFIRHGMLQREIKGKLRFPKFIRMLYRFIFLFCVAFFIIVEQGIVKDMSCETESGLEYIIVLGAAVRGDEPTTPLLLRMETAKEYLDSNPTAWAVASGGKGEGESISEAECIRNYLIEGGIKPYRILTESSSRDTEENLRNSFEMIGNPSVRVGIVTNSFHIYRALLIANRLGYRNVCGIPAETLMPLGVHYVVREFFAVTKIFVDSIMA